MRLSCNAECNTVNTSVSVFYYLCSCLGAKFNSVLSYSPPVIILHTLQHRWPQLLREGQTKKYVIQASGVLKKERASYSLGTFCAFIYVSALIYLQCWSSITG